MYRTLAAAVLFLPWAAGWAASDYFPSVEPAEPQVSLWREMFPLQKWQNLSSHSEGLFFDSSLPVVTVDSLSELDHEAVPDKLAPYRFISGDDSPRVLLFEGTQGQNATKSSKVKFPKEGGDDGEYVADVSFHSRRTSKIDDLSEAIHVVRLRINRGFGARGFNDVVADKVEVLDGKGPLKKLKPARLARAWLARQRGVSRSRQVTRETETALTKLKSEGELGTLLRGIKVTQLTYERYRPTWDASSQLFKLVYYRRVEHHYRKLHKNPHPHAGSIWCDSPPGSKGCAPEKIPLQLQEDFAFAVERATRVSFNGAGKQTEHVDLPPRSWAVRSELEEHHEPDEED